MKCLLNYYTATQMEDKKRAINDLAVCVGARGQPVHEEPGEGHVQDPAGGDQDGGEHHQVLKLCI